MGWGGSISHNGYLGFVTVHSDWIESCEYDSVDFWLLQIWRGCGEKLITPCVAVHDVVLKDHHVPSDFNYV